MAQIWDVVVIGGGPGGYVAALQAARHGLATALVEKAELGGVCLNWGCIPTKALLRSAEVLRLAQSGAAFGVRIAQAEPDLPAMIARSRAIAGQLAEGIRFLLRKSRVTVVQGTGRLAGAGRVVVEKPADAGDAEVLTTRAVILATGARPRVLPGLEPDGQRIWTSRDALAATRIPTSLLVVGSGAIGLEFASFFQTLGSAVTVVEVQEQILPLEDAEIAALAVAHWRRQGMTLYPGTTVRDLTTTEDGVRVRLQGPEGERSVVFAQVLVAAGITANRENLGLETTRVRVEGGHVVTDPWNATDEPGVWAIGDLAGPPWLAHKASHEAVLCVEALVARRQGTPPPPPWDRRRTPSCIYTWPQIASLGLREEAARAAGQPVRVGRFPFRANGKALAQGEAEGLVKVLFAAESGAVLGVHMIGPDVAELIPALALAQTLEATEAEFAATVFPHPTLSEAIPEAVLAAWGAARHI